MAVSQNPQNPQRTPQEQEMREQVRYLDEQALSLKNILRLKKEISKAERDSNIYNQLSAKLSTQQTKNARDYAAVTDQVEALEKRIKQAKEQGTQAGNRAAKQLENQLRNRQAAQRDLLKTEGGYVEMQSRAAAKRLGQLEAERDLVKDINSKRNIGTRLMDLFRSKEARQRQIDLARAQKQGGANLPPGTDGAGEGKGAGADGKGKDPSLFILALKKSMQLLAAPIQALGKLASSAITAPFADAAQLLTGEDFGMGSGKVRTSGPGSVLGGIQQFASSIPIIGGLLGGLTGIVKSIVEGILGIEQGIIRFARAINVSTGQANRMRSTFAAIAASSGHIAINADRMMHSQAEIGNQLGINKQLSGDILKNDVLLRDVIGTESDIRQTIAQTSITTGKNATKLTQNIIGTTIQFNKLVGTGFSFNGVMKEAAKLTGVIGLQFSKYPEKMTNTLLITKTLGMELQQLDSSASSLLDFESSINKEMEAQVLTGREMNLTLARQAALNNDYATLAKEIAKNVGSTADYLNLTRIEQEGIAESVGMSANSLADVLRKQELYSKLGATDLKTFNERIALMEKEGKTRTQISEMIGKDAYNAYTQVSTAERITETLEKMKRAFVELIKQSGIFDFITRPERITGFVRALADKLASVIDIVGRVVATLMEGVAYVVGLFSEQKASEIRGLAGAIRGGTGTFAESMRVATGALGGQQAPSVGATVQGSARQEMQGRTSSGVGRGAAVANAGRPIAVHSVVQVDRQVLGRSTVQVLPEQYDYA